MFVRLNTGRLVMSSQGSYLSGNSIAPAEIMQLLSDNRLEGWGTFRLKIGGIYYDLVYEYFHMVNGYIFSMIDVNKRLYLLRRVRSIILLGAIGIILTFSLAASILTT